MKSKAQYAKEIEDNFKKNAWRTKEDVDVVRCPKCGSTQIQLHDRKRFGWGRGCLGAIFFWPLILLGLTKKPKTERICLNCKKVF